MNGRTALHVVGGDPWCQCAPTACGGVIVDSDPECKYHSLWAIGQYGQHRDMHWADDCPARPKVGRPPKRRMGRAVMGSLRITEREEEALILLAGSVPKGLRLALDAWMRSLGGTPPAPAPVTIGRGE